MAASLRYEVEENLTCSLCLEVFTNPKVLPCLHSYCHDCIVNLTKSAESNTITCPDCQLVVEADVNTISKLPSNFSLNNLLATMSLTNDKPVSKEVLCDSCDSKDTAESRCNECRIFLCQFCTEFHKRSRLLKHHELVTVGELKSNPGLSTIAEKVQCFKHKKEIIQLFCKTCQTTTCRNCIITDHRQHEYAFVEEVAVEEKQHLQQNLDDVKQRKARVVQGITDLKKFSKTLETKKNLTISEINYHFDELAKSVSKSLDCRKNEMVEKANSLTNLKQTQICAQLEVLQVALASCESSIEFTEQAFKNSDDVQILSVKKYILQSLEQLKTVKDQTEPCVTENMAFVIPSSSLQEINRKHLNNYDVNGTAASPENCTASFEQDDEKFSPGKQYFIALICFDRNGKRLDYGGQKIAPSFTGADVGDVTVHDNKDGSHTVSFSPRHGGMLKFEVSVNGIPASNCSLTKQVKWVISDSCGKGFITDGGLTMKGEECECEYYWRVGQCYFESGVHSWKVQFDHSQDPHSLHVTQETDTFYDDPTDFFLDSQPHLFGGKTYIPGFEVGIVDSTEIDSGIKYKVQRDCVYLGSLFGENSFRVVTVSLDMDKGTLNITQNPSTVDDHGSSEPGNVVSQSYFFSSRRVLPFFACWSPQTTLRLVET